LIAPENALVVHVQPNCVQRRGKGMRTHERRIGPVLFDEFILEATAHGNNFDIQFGFLMHSVPKIKETLIEIKC